jgi:predicted NUDIX family phosphoesterase
MNEQILVVKSKSVSTLIKDVFTTDIRILPTLLLDGEFITREKAETDPTYKQIVPYSILRYQNYVFRYKRSDGGGEPRLYDLFSIGVGGHVNPTDVPRHGSNLLPTIEVARERELREEFQIVRADTPHVVGLLNDDSDSVGRVHLGVIYEYWLANRYVASKEKEKVTYHEFISLANIVIQDSEYENWSRIIIQQYLKTQISLTKQ